jgi:hypothetical protein
MHIHTQADPFLFVHRGELFLFFECQAADCPGWIVGYKTKDLVSFVPVGDVLRQPYHASYPYVFGVGSDVYMIPESQAAGELQLYQFNPFPQKLLKSRVLLSGRYADPSPFKVGDTWFLFATTKRGLELFFTDDIVNGDLDLHPKSPLTDDPRFSRCGGVPFRIGEKYYRPAQNCAEVYGGNLSLMEIQELNRSHYSERLIQADICGKDQHWNRGGGHHISMATYNEKIVIALDGWTYDYYVHKIIGRFYASVADFCRNCDTR